MNLNTETIKNLATFQISITSLAEYLEATEARKIAIIKEQYNPNKRSFRYKLAKARIKKSIELGGDLEPVHAAIKILKKRVPEKDWQITDIPNSISALEKYAGMALPDLVRENELEILSGDQKHFTFHGISVWVAPELVFRVNVDGIKYIGACKLRVSKDKPFSTRQSKLVAAIIDLYLNRCVAEEDDVVHPVLCFCLDPFAGTTINSNSKVNLDMKVVKKICKEIKQFIAEQGDAENVA